MRLLVLMLAAALLVFGCAGAGQQKNDSVGKPGDSMQKPGDSMNKPGSMVKNDSMDGNNSMGKNDSMIGKNDSMMNGSMEKPVGYVPFTKSAYEQARSDGKVIFLEFYANWCPTCAAQAPALESAFNDLTEPGIAAFRVNYKDSDTDADEQAIAREFGITYQHTHIILDRSGKVAKRSQESWTREQILSEVEKVADSDG